MRIPRRERVDTRPLTYFSSDTYTLMVSHAPDIAPAEVVERLARNTVVGNNRVLARSIGQLLKYVRDGERLPLTYRPAPGFWEDRATLPPTRGHNGGPPPAVSLIFADLPGRRRDDTREMIAFVNEVNHALDGLDDDQDVVIQALVPMWFCQATPKVIGTGGPGARPVAAPPLDPHWWGSAPDDPDAPFAFRSAVLQPGGARSSRHAVEVVVLDTAPSEKQLRAAYDRWGKEHPLIRSLLEPDANGARRLRTSYAADFLAGNGPGLPRDTGIKGHEYTMEDHGLFAAGIVHSLAPAASVHLVEVLNAFGVGTLETIARGVEVALARRAPDGEALILNCSLMLSLPRPKTETRAGHPAPDFPWMIADGDRWHAAWALPLRLICERARGMGALVVAAAGNDGQVTPDEPNGVRPAARYPAAFPEVLGVGALVMDGSPAGYSNFSDEPISRGLVTFGGDLADSAPLAAAEPMVADEKLGVLGIYTGNIPDPHAMLPTIRTGAYPRPRPSTSGWARWAGTSFATPVISGLLAHAIALGTAVADAEQALRDGEAGTSTLGEQTVSVTQG